MSAGDKPDLFAEEMPDGEKPADNEAPQIKSGSASVASSPPTTAVNLESAPKNDSFDVPVKKNVIMVWALLNVGLVTFMAILFYVLYQSQQN